MTTTCTSTKYRTEQFNKERYEHNVFNTIRRTSLNSQNNHYHPMSKHDHSTASVSSVGKTSDIFHSIHRDSISVETYAAGFGAVEVSLNMPGSDFAQPVSVANDEGVDSDANADVPPPPPPTAEKDGISISAADGSDFAQPVSAANDADADSNLNADVPPPPPPAAEKDGVSNSAAGYSSNGIFRGFVDAISRTVVLSGFSPLSPSREQIETQSASNVPPPPSTTSRPTSPTNSLYIGSSSNESFTTARMDTLENSDSPLGTDDFWTESNGSAQMATPKEMKTDADKTPVAGTAFSPSRIAYRPGIEEEKKVDIDKTPVATTAFSLSPFAYFRSRKTPENPKDANSSTTENSQPNANSKYALDFENTPVVRPDHTTRVATVDVTSISSHVHPTRVNPHSDTETVLNSDLKKAPLANDLSIYRSAFDPSDPDVNTPAFRAIQANEAVKVTKLDKFFHATKYQSVRRIAKKTTLYLGVVQKKRRLKPPRAHASEAQYFYTSNELVLPTRPCHISERDGSGSKLPTVEEGSPKQVGFQRLVLRARRKKKKKERPPHIKGKVIDNEHERYLLSIAIMLGLRTVIESTRAELERFRFENGVRMHYGLQDSSKRNQDGEDETQWLNNYDFYSVDKYLFPASGSLRTPAHNLRHTFKFKVYSPKAFAYIRRLFGVNESDFVNSLCGKANFIEFTSNAKSGNFFFYSMDGKYMVKTMNDEESKFLRRILPHYFQHCVKYPNTFISPFMGMYRVKLYHLMRNVKFIIMLNVFGGDKELHRIYDLKGSVLGREAPGHMVQKDNDLRRTINRDAIYLQPNTVDIMREQILKDLQFFRKNKIMDYSILAGVHRFSEATETPNRRTALNTHQKRNSSSFRLNLGTAPLDVELLKEENNNTDIPSRQALSDFDSDSDESEQQLQTNLCQTEPTFPRTRAIMLGGAPVGMLNSPLVKSHSASEEKLKFFPNTKLSSSGHRRSLSLPSERSYDDKLLEKMDHVLDQSDSMDSVANQSLNTMASVETEPTRLVSNLARDSFSPSSVCNAVQRVKEEVSDPPENDMSDSSFVILQTSSTDQPFYDAACNRQSAAIIDYHLEEDDDYSYLDGETYFRGTNDTLTSELMDIDTTQGIPITKLPPDIVDNIDWRKELGSEQIFWPFHRYYDVQGRRRITPMKIFSCNKAESNNTISNTDTNTPKGNEAIIPPYFLPPVSLRKDKGFEQQASEVPLPNSSLSIHVDRRVVYMGIIDVLQQYTFRKRIETAWRRMFTKNREDASCVDPEMYADRFLKFFEEIVRYNSIPDEKQTLTLENGANKGLDDNEDVRGMELISGQEEEPGDIALQEVEMTPLMSRIGGGTLRRRRKLN